MNRNVEKLAEFYEDSTFKLIVSYTDKLKNEADKTSYAGIFKHFFCTMNKDLLNTDTDDMKCYVNLLLSLHKSGKMKYNTILKYRRIIAGFLSYVETLSSNGAEGVPSNYISPIKYIYLEIPKEIIKEDSVPSIADLDRIIGYSRLYDTRLCLAILFSLRCFLRVSEFIRLRVSDFFLDSTGENCYLKVFNRNEYVFVPYDFYEYLEASLDKLNISNGYIFSSPQGNHYTIRWIEKRLLSACREVLGDRSYTFNQIRNMAAVLATTNGADEALIMETMGYKTNKHIARLSSLKIRVNSAAEYVNIAVKPLDDADGAD